MSSLIPKAYKFLCLVFFFLNFQVKLSSSSSSSCSHDEASALIQFKSSLSIMETDFYYYYSRSNCDVAGINSYPKTDSWKEGTNCCSWDGVKCDNIKGHVIGLDLSCSLLYGSIPSNNSLFHLRNLRKLNLAFNDFNNSKMSSRFGEFTNLLYLNLSESNIAGQVPPQVSYLSKLVSLDLSHNYDQSFDKHTLGRLVRNLTEVRQLFLDGIDMSFIDPNLFMNLSLSLQSLSLFGCNLQGKFPDNIFHQPNLKTLKLGFNENLTLCLLEFNQSSLLEYLDLSSMFFSRELVDSIDNLVSLMHLDLNLSNLSGSIPISLAKLLQLSYLDLSENSFSGHIPSWIYTIPSLKFIRLNNNRFRGRIREFQCNSLEEIDFSYNKLQGPVPSSISQLLNLTILDLSSNNLSGIVEFDMFSKLQNLQGLVLSSNHLSLNFNGISDDCTLLDLQYLGLSSCNISEFPQFLRRSENLYALDLSDNRIYGKIPKWMHDVGKYSLSFLNLSHNSLTDIEQLLPWKDIEVLDLSSNLFHGDLPIPSLTTTTFFLISNNNLSGEIYSLICNASSLKALDLSHNNLSGTIPQCFGNLSRSLSLLNLEMNKFHGIIPSFTKGCKLKSLKLHGNQLEGPLTQSILNCTSLEVLDLGNNKIKDTFPHWLGSLPQLQVLVLRSNQLQGSIHDTRSNTLSFSKIQIFDLSSNYFTGTLPVRYIKNFEAMIVNLSKNEGVDLYLGVQPDPRRGIFYSYSIEIAMKGVEREVQIFIKLTSIDLSNNMFEGKIPKVIGKLNSLHGLNLSHNNLSGYIPASIGNMISLEWLDLSSNNLIGMIPEKLLDLTFLAFFNISENQLEGHIPQGKQFNTFGNDSYEGNDGLCGFPVSKGCGNSEPPPSNLEESSKSDLAFGWKAVLMGYGCGVVFGLAMGYLVFQTGKPKWLVTFVEDHQHCKIGNRRGGGRRI